MGTSDGRSDSRLRELKLEETETSSSHRPIVLPDCWPISMERSGFHGKVQLYDLKLGVQSKDVNYLRNALRSMSYYSQSWPNTQVTSSVLFDTCGQIPQMQQIQLRGIAALWCATLTRGPWPGSFQQPPSDYFITTMFFSTSRGITAHSAVRLYYECE